MFTRYDEFIYCNLSNYIMESGDYVFTVNAYAVNDSTTITDYWTGTSEYSPVYTYNVRNRFDTPRNLSVDRYTLNWEADNSALSGGSYALGYRTLGDTTDFRAWYTPGTALSDNSMSLLPLLTSRVPDYYEFAIQAISWSIEDIGNSYFSEPITVYWPGIDGYLSEADRVSAAEDALTWNVIKGVNVSQSSVGANLYLPTTGLYGSTISWSSSNTSVISNTGVVNKPVVGAPNQAVTLTATISIGSVSGTVVFQLTVIAPQPVTEAELFQYYPSLVCIPGANDNPYGVIYKEVYSRATEIVNEDGTGFFGAFMGMLKPSRSISTLIRGREATANLWFDSAVESLYLEITQHMLLDSLSGVNAFKDAFDQADAFVDMLDAIDSFSRLSDRFVDSGMLGESFSRFNGMFSALDTTQKVAKFTLLAVALYSAELETLEILINRIDNSFTRDSEFHRTLQRLHGRLLVLDPAEYVLHRFLDANLLEKIIDAALGVLPLNAAVNNLFGFISDAYSLFFPTGEEDVKAFFYEAGYNAIASAMTSLKTDMILDRIYNTFDQRKMHDYRTLYNAYVVTLREYAKAARALTRGTKINELDARLNIMAKYNSYDGFINHCRSEAANSLHDNLDYIVTENGIVINGYKSPAILQRLSSNATTGHSAISYLPQSLVQYNANTAETDSILVIPSQIGGVPVIGIGENAFSGIDSLSYVYIGEGILFIGKGAFSNCASLEIVNISSSVMVQQRQSHSIVSKR